MQFRKNRVLCGRRFSPLVQFQIRFAARVQPPEKLVAYMHEAYDFRGDRDNEQPLGAPPHLRFLPTGQNLHVHLQPWPLLRRSLRMITAILVADVDIAIAVVSAALGPPPYRMRQGLALPQCHRVTSPHVRKHHTHGLILCYGHQHC